MNYKIHSKNVFLTVVIVAFILLFVSNGFSQPTINSARHFDIDQSLVTAIVSEPITSFTTGNTGFTITIDGIPATFENPPFLANGSLYIVFDIVEIIENFHTVQLIYNGAGDAQGASGALQAGTLNSLNDRILTCADFTNFKGNDVNTDGVCADVNAQVETRYQIRLAGRNSTNFNVNDVFVRYDWGDAVPTIDDVSATENYGVVFSEPASRWETLEVFVYPNADPCGHILQVNPAYDFNGNGNIEDTEVCLLGEGGTDLLQQIGFPVFELDNQNTGNLALDPVLIEHCVNTPMDTTIYDVTNYNCNVATVNAQAAPPTFANLEQRYVRFTYGTPNGPRKIPNMWIGATPGTSVRITDNNGNFLVPMNTLNGYEDPRGAISIPGTLWPIEQVLNETLNFYIFAPGYEVIGDEIEVTIENWNQCNPYLPGAGSYTSSIQTTAIIRIVGNLEPNLLNNGVYCDGDAVPAIAVTDAPVGNYVEWFDDYDPNDPTVGTLVHTGSGTSGLWDAPPDTVTIGTTATYYTQYNGSCPSETRTPVTLTKYATPVGTDVPAGTYFVCTADNVNINPQIYTDIAGSTFTWNGSNGSSGSGIIIDNPVNSTNSDLNITYTIIPTSPAPGSCPGNPFTIVVTVSPEPIVTPGLSQTVCSGDPASLNLTFENNISGGATFFWNSTPLQTGGMTGGTNRPDPGNTSPITDIFNNPTAINQTATYAVTGKSTVAGCYGSPENVTITVLPPLVPSNDLSIADNTFCYGEDPGLISGSDPTGGTGAYSFQWQSSPDNAAWTDISGATGASYNPIVVTADIYFRRLETSGPCSDISNTVFLDVTPELIPSIVGPGQVICNGDTPGQLSGPDPTGGEGVGTYNFQWQQSSDNSTWFDLANGDPNYGWPVSVNSSTLSFAASLPSSTFFRRRVVSGECTTVSNSVFIQSTATTPPKPVIDQGIANLCVGTTNVTYGIITPNPLDDPNGYIWIYDNGSTTTSINQMNSINYDFLISGTVNITVIASNGCGNSPVSDPFVVIVDQQPVANAGGPAGADQCDLDFELNSTPSIGTGLWTLESGPGIVVNWGAGQDQASTTIAVDIYGAYTFRWTETNNTCSDFDEITVNFFEQPISVAGIDENICNSLSFTFDATPYSYLPNPNISSESRQWTLVSGPGNVSSWGAGQDQPNTSVTVDAFGNGTPYIFRWTETNGSCSDFGEISIYFWEQTVSDAGPNSENCGPVYTLEANDPLIGIGTWSIISQPAGATVSFGNANDEINDHDAKANVDMYGIYEFQWEVTNGACSAADIVQVNYRTPVILSTGGDQFIAAGSSTAPLGGTISGGASTGLWSVVSATPGGIFSPNATNLNATFGPTLAQTTDGLITLRLTSADPAGICPAVWEDVQISIGELPEVYITSPADGAAFCADEIITLDGYFDGSANQATWSADNGGGRGVGTGTFTTSVFNTTPFTTQYIPSSADTAAGLVQIFLTTDDPDAPGPPILPAETKINIILNSIPITSPIVGLQDVCVGTESVLYRVDGIAGSPGSNYSWTLNPIDGNQPILTQLGNVAVLDFGPNQWSGTIEVIESKLGCAGTPVTLDINSYSLPIADPGPDQTICNDASVILGGSPTASGGSGNYSYTWTPALDIDDPTIANPTASLTNPLPVQISRIFLLMVTDVNTGCFSSTENVTVTFDPLPELADNLDKLVCSNEISGVVLDTDPSSPIAGSFDILNISIDAGLNPDVGNSSAPSNVSSGGIENDIFINPLNIPLYVTYDIVPIGVTGCRGPMDSIVLTINDVPTASLTSDTVHVCEGQEVVLQVDFTGIPPYTLTYRDNLGNMYVEITGENSVQFTHTPPLGNIEYTLLSVSSISSTCSGTVSGTTYVQVHDLPSGYVSVGGAVIGDSSVEICKGDSVDITFRFTGTAPWSMQYEIDMGTVTTVNNITDPVYTINVKPDNTTRYTLLSVTDGSLASCEGPVSGRAEIIVYDSPVASFNADNLLDCAPLDVIFTNSSSGNLQGSNTGYYYREEGGDPYILMSHDEFLAYTFENNTTNPINYDVIFIAESSLGCADTVAKVITVDPAIQLDISTDHLDDGCSPHLVTFTNHKILETVYYVWEWGDGEPNDTTTSETSIDHVYVNNSNINTKTFVVEITGIDMIYGCEERINTSIHVDPAITVQIEPNVTEGCGPLVVGFSNNTEEVQEHQWFYRPKGTFRQDGTLNSPFATYELRNQTQDSMIYEIIYIAENRFGCQDSDTVDIIVWPELHPGFIADPPRQILPESTISITDQTNEGPWEYSWNFSDGNISTDPDLENHRFETYGEYQVLLEVTYGPCQAYHIENVVVEPITPRVDFTADIRSGCRPLTVNFKNLSRFADIDSYYWEFGDDQGWSNAVDPTFTFYDPGLYTVRLEATNELGIVVMEEKEYYIEVYDNPIAQFNVRPNVVYVPDQPIYTSNLSFGAIDYFWDFGDGVGTSTEEEPIYYYAEPGIYDVYLWVANEYGCADSLLAERAVLAEIGGNVATPNVFTPSPDGPGGAGGGIGNPAFNDVFLPYEEGAVEFHLQIFNRWGEMLYESYDKNVGWDGYYKNKLASSDVYVYRLDLKLNDGRRITKLGDVMLLR